jgi:hypothetical protein
MKQTFLDRVRESLTAAMADYNREDVTAQRLVIFPDKTGEWEPIIARLRGTLPIVTFGEYNPSTLTGPAVYIRSLVFRTIDSNLPEGQTPIIYLPGCSREQLRNLEECPDEIKPLAGLQYLGEVWSQRNGRDWTLLAYLKTHQGGLSLKVNDEPETREAIKNAANVLADESVEFLKSREPLNAAFFDDLHHADPARQILQWMNEPDGEKQTMKTAGNWKSFCAKCKKEYEIDPEKDGAASAAEKLGMQGGKWADVWKRFKEKPVAYPQIPQILRNTKMPTGWFPYTDSWPQFNDAREKELALVITSLADVAPDNVRIQIADLEKAHAQRRTWVWAEMRESPLARALEHLAILAKITKETKFGGTVEEQAERYTQNLWKADDAVVRALEQATNKTNLKAITIAINALYPAWLNEMADAFQKEWKRAPVQFTKENHDPVMGEVILFVDGLRMDLGHRLCSMITDDGCSCTLSHRFSALPTETSTAKPAVMPIAGELNAGEKLTPKTRSGAMANLTALRIILEEKGFCVLADLDTGNPQKSAWTDCANIDEEGHSKGIELPLVLDRELKRICNRVTELLDAGWHTVKIVTDHGWLLLPGGLPKTDLKPALAEIKKSRYAQIRPDAVVDYPVIPWSWDRNVRIALAPGITSFEEGKIYAHGGLSPQEVVVPEIIVSRESQQSGGIDIGEPAWAGLRCRVRVEGAVGNIADIRLQPADAQSSCASGGKQIDIEGNVALVVVDDSLEGKTEWLVVLDGRKNVIAQRKIRIGGD